MRIERVRVGAFGPFRDRSLELAPGLTVVFGPNEAGKSSWHAALFAGLCGLRRGSGGGNREDREFAQRHKPWNGEGWQVSVTLQLADGRRVEIRQDLERKLDCSVRDLVQGQDLRPEILNEGTPDASRWLGLDRRTFLATACVRQADVLDVLSSADKLQEHLQRAAATGGGDETAAAALALLDEFAKEHVGQDRAGSTKPLRRAKEWLERARDELQRAKREHEDYLELVERAERLEVEARERERERARFEAALAQREAAGWEERLRRARELQARCSGPEPAPLPADDELSRRVASALSAFESLSPPVALQGPTAAEIQSQLDSLPPMPEGDLEPDPDVTQARLGWEGAGQALQAHDRQRPPDPESVTVPLPASELRALAAQLQEPVAPAPLPAGRLPLWLGFVLGGIVAAAGAALAVGVSLVVGLAMLAVGALLVAGTALWAALRRSSTRTEELRAAESRRRRSEAAGRARQLGLPDDPWALVQLAERLEAAELARERLEAWQATRRDLARRWSEAAEALRAALASRGAELQDDPAAAYWAYVEACRRRSEQARSAQRRADLERLLRQRQDLEASAAEHRRRRQEVLEELREVAARCGVVGADDEALAEGLRQWQSRRSQELERRETERRERAELTGLLEGGTLADLQARVEGYRRRAEELGAGFQPAELDALDFGPSPPTQLDALTRTAQAARSQADRARGELTTLAARLPSVARAEEEVEAAEAELARVERLAATLSVTREYLERAEKEVHRTMAPVLKRHLEDWLPRITQGRYREATVAPDSLRVLVRAVEGEWRDAALLSQGTREQIFLLLRLALVEALGNPREVCPLVLDDVTVQSDTARTEALLELLHEISRQRQVILFSQEDDVRAWAERRLREPCDRLIVLDPKEVPA